MDSHLLQTTVGSLVKSLVEQGARSATRYLSPKLRVRASRKLFGPPGKRGIHTDEPIEIVLTIGRPNYNDREFIKNCKKAKEPFPIKKVQFTFPSRPRRK